MHTTEVVLQWALNQKPHAQSQHEKDGYAKLASACRRYDGDMGALVTWLHEQIAIEFGHTYEQEVYHVALHGIVNL